MHNHLPIDFDEREVNATMKAEFCFFYIIHINNTTFTSESHFRTSLLYILPVAEITTE